MKLVLIDDAFRFVRTFAQISIPGSELFGILVGYGSPEIYDSTGEREDITFSKAIEGAEIIFLDHNMPQKGDVVFEQLKSQGLITGQTRVIGTSSDNQPYLKEQISAQSAVDPAVLAEMINGR